MPDTLAPGSGRSSDFHPPWKRDFREGGAKIGWSVSSTRGGEHDAAALPRYGSAFLCRCGLTPIQHPVRMQNSSHADATRNVSYDPGNQAGASRAGVGLQPPAPVADQDGADGADATLHCSNRGGLPPPLARAGEGSRSVRPRRGGALARSRSLQDKSEDTPQPFAPAKRPRSALPARDRAHDRAAGNGCAAVAHSDNPTMRGRSWPRRVGVNRTTFYVR